MNKTGIRARHAFHWLLPLVLLWLACPTRAQLPVVQFGIAAEGRIVPGEGLLTLGAPPGSQMLSLEVQRGDPAKRGDLLARLSSYPAAQHALTQARIEAEASNAAVAIAQSHLDAAESAHDLAKIQVTIVEAQNAEAGIAVEVAQAAKLRALAEHDAAIALIEGQIAEHQRVLDELDPPRREREELRVKQAMLRLERDRLAAVRSLLDGELTAHISQAQAAAETSSRQLEAAKTTLRQTRLEMEAANALLQQSHMRAEAARAGISRAEAEVRSTEIRAPIDGQVIAINARPGEIIGPEGVLYFGDTSRMYVEAQVYVDDIRRLRTGQQATITGSALDGSLIGTVEEIGLMVTPANLFHPDPTIFTDRRVVLVRIALENGSAVSHLTYAQVTVRINPANN